MVLGSEAILLEPSAVYLMPIIGLPTLTSTLSLTNATYLVEREHVLAKRDFCLNNPNVWYYRFEMNNLCK